MVPLLWAGGGLLAYGLYRYKTKKPLTPAVIAQAEHVIANSLHPGQLAALSTALSNNNAPPHLVQAAAAKAQALSTTFNPSKAPSPSIAASMAGMWDSVSAMSSAGAPAIKSFQSAAGIDADGQVGPQTKAAYNFFHTGVITLPTVTITPGN